MRREKSITGAVNFQCLTLNACYRMSLGGVIIRNPKVGPSTRRLSEYSSPRHAGWPGPMFSFESEPGSRPTDSRDDDPRVFRTSLKFIREGFYLRFLSGIQRGGIILLFLAGVCQADGNKVFKLEDCVQLGLESYVPLKLAEEEVELSRLKKQEAYRGYFPVVSIKAEETDGKTNDLVSPDFEERVVGASLSHKVYQGGKINATYRQAYFSHLAAERSREKEYQDFIYKVREAFWSLAASQQNLEVREKNYQLIKEDLKRITDQYVQDLAVKQQFLAVKGQYLQAANQLNESKKSFSQARWNLAKALGLARPPDFQVETRIPFEKLNIDLAEALRLAASHRPDLYMQRQLVETARAGKKAAQADYLPEVNLNTFYGKSGSAFETEELDLKEDWQINAKLSQRFLGSSLGIMSSKIKTSPKLGQSSRTDTETKGVNLNLFDSMKNKTDYKGAQLNYRRELLKLKDLEKDIAIDVETAFYNVNQSILQVEFTEEDLKLAEEELKVAESKQKYGLSETLEVAKARNRFGLSRTARMDALSAYQVALAGLNRAVGIVDKFVVK